MSDEQISDAEHGKQVRARLAAATPGPWEAHGRQFCEADSLGWVGEVEIGADAELIAHAPADLARLLARAEAAEAALKRLRGTWFPGRWWRAVDAEGDLWCESSNEAEVRSMARPTDRVQRLFEYGSAEWRDA